MEKQTISNIKLGVFVISGLFILVFSLYMVGRNKNLFGAKFELRANFKNVSGLMKGNNVRFSGIQAGIVKDIIMHNDTTIEVVLLIDKQTKRYIRKSSIASIGSEGLMGNKIVNIEPGDIAAPPVDDGDILITSIKANVDNMIETLGKTNENIAIVSNDLKQTVTRINDSKALWDILGDTNVSANFRYSMSNLRKASNSINNTAHVLNNIVVDVNKGKGTLGILLKDTLTANALKESITKVNNTSHQIETTLFNINSITGQAKASIENGHGILNIILSDTDVNSLRVSIHNIESGTSSFNENMDALKRNFLFRRYFKPKRK